MAVRSCHPQRYCSCAGGGVPRHCASPSAWNPTETCGWKHRGGSTEIALSLSSGTPALKIVKMNNKTNQMKAKEKQQPHIVMYFSTISYLKVK